MLEIIFELYTEQTKLILMPFKYKIN